MGNFIKRRKIIGLKEETLDLRVLRLEIFLRIDQNPRLITPFLENIVSVYRLRPSLSLERMIVNNLDSGLVEQVDDPAINLCL